jgi:diguanylate cyclase (GGDEF)-like protein
MAVLGNVLPIVLLASHDSRDHSPVFLVGTGVALAAPVLVTVAPPGHRVLTHLFAYAGIVGLTLMQWNHGGVESPYAILLAMPMIWFGMTGSAREIRAVGILVAACCFVPMIVAPAHYPEAYRTATALTIILVAVNLSIAVLTRETGRLTSRLQQAATHDQLTDLLNRRGWEEATSQVMSQAPAGTPMSVVLVDLDGLKKLNDTMGHDEGDRELRATGERLATAFGQEAAVSRLGGDEFALLLVGSTADQVHGRLEELRRCTPEGGAFSAGIAVVAPAESLRDTMRRADLALYEVKSTGRGRTALADPALSVDGS